MMDLDLKDILLIVVSLIARRATERLELIYLNARELLAIGLKARGIW